MTHIARVAAVSLALVLATCAGFWIGFRSGYLVAGYADAPVRGALAIHQLNDLERQRTDRMRLLLESQIDTGLIMAHEFEATPFSGRLQALWGIPDNWKVEYLPRLADYRKTHPSNFTDSFARELPATTSEERAVRDSMLSDAAKTAAIIKYMTERYASKQ